MGHKNEKLSLIIDQNRLTALSQNGYVSHYWYDADGERTVKMCDTGMVLLSRVAFVVGLNKNGLSKKTSKKTDN